MKRNKQLLLSEAPKRNSIRGFVRPSVRPSVRRSVGPYVPCYFYTRRILCRVSGLVHLLIISPWLNFLVLANFQKVSSNCAIKNNKKNKMKSKMFKTIFEITHDKKKTIFICRETVLHYIDETALVPLHTAVIHRPLFRNSSLEEGPYT